MTRNWYDVMALIQCFEFDIISCSFADLILKAESFCRRIRLHVPTCFRTSKFPNQQNEFRHHRRMCSQSKNSFFVPDGITSGTIGLYGNSRRCLLVCVSVMRESVRTMKFYVFLCLFHVVAIKLEFWNFAYAFLASIPICMHGFIMIRILLLPFAYVLKILKLFLYSFRFKELGARNSTRR